MSIINSSPRTISINVWSSMQHVNQLSTIAYRQANTQSTQGYVHPETSTTRGKTGGEPYPTLLCNTMKNANWQTRTRGNSVPNSTLSTLWLVAALTLCSLQMLLQVLPPQATPIERTPPRESSNRKQHRLCNEVCVWMNIMNSIRLTQAIHKEQLLESTKPNCKALKWFKGLFN